MLFRATIRSIACLILVFWLTTPPAHSAPADDELVARVGSIPVTRPELDREAESMLPMQGGVHGGVDPAKLRAIRQKALKRLIERAYMVQYALQEKIEADPREVKKIFQEVQERFPSRKEFQAALGNESLTEFRAAIERRQLADRAYEKAVALPARIDDAEAQAHYERHKSVYFRPKRFRSSLIQIKVDPTASEETKLELKKKAEAIATRARGGEDFYDLAYYHSDDRTRYVGGDLGFLREGQLLPELEGPLLKLKPGEVAGPIETAFGYNVMKLTELEDGKQLSFAEARDEIRQTLEKDRAQKLLAAWMGDLREKYAVQRVGSTDSSGK